MKPSLILTIIGAILIFLSFLLQLMSDVSMYQFLILFIAGLLLCVLCFLYFLMVDLKFFEKGLDAITEIFKDSSEHVNTSQTRYCPNCGRQIPLDARICPYCRKKYW